MFEQDDAENWEEMQHILRGAKSRETGFTYNMRRVPVSYDDDGYPGASTAHVYSDNAALNMYGFYRDLMEDKSWEQLKAERGGVPEVDQRDFTKVMDPEAAAAAAASDGAYEGNVD